MSPQEIAREAARRILVKSPVTQQHLEEAVEYNAALILTAAAKMVRESGAVEALEGAGVVAYASKHLAFLQREYQVAKDAGLPNPWPGADEATLKDIAAITAALAKLRALTEHSGKPQP